MEFGFETETNSGWYRPDDRRARAPRSTDFVYPVRINRSKRPIGWFQSLANKASNPFHSELERQTMLLLDVTPNVARFSSQPGRIKYLFGIRDCSYTPDLRVELRTGKLVFIEVKPNGYYRVAENVARAQAIDEAIRGSGASYRVVTDKYLSSEPRRSNVRRLQLYRPILPDLQTAHLIDMLLASREHATIAQLTSLSTDPALGRQTVMSLILRRHLIVNLNAIIGADTIVRRNSR